MSDAPINVTAVNGLFKTIFADKIKDLRPDHTIFSNMVPFVPQKKRSGAAYQQPVILKSEHGITYGGTDGDAFTYNDAVAGACKFASINPAEMVLKSVIARAVLSRSENLTEGSFANGIQHSIDNMLQSMHTKYEAQCFYGGVGLGTVASVAGNVITITTAEWAPGIWVGGEGMKLDAYASDNTTLHRAATSITAVDLVNRTITVDTITSIVAGDILYEVGAKGKEFDGVHKILTAISGNVFGLSVATYSLWRGNTYAVGSAAFSFAKLSQGIASAVAKGVKGQLDLFVNPRTWSNLLTEQTAQRVMHEGGMAEYSNGAENITFYSINGKVVIHASSFVKEGFAYALDMSTFLRIGSKDITFDNPIEAGKYIVPLEGSNAVQILCYTDSALFCSSLGKSIVFTGIQNS